jgi:hypothetical protein
VPESFPCHAMESGAFSPHLDLNPIFLHSPLHTCICLLLCFTSILHPTLNPTGAGTMPVSSATSKPLPSIVFGAYWLSKNAHSVIEVNVPFVHEIIMVVSLFPTFLRGKIRT